MNNQPDNTDASSNPPPAWGRKMKRSRMRLQTVGDCRAALGLLIRETRSGLISTEALSRYANALSVLSRMIETSDVERRLEAVEAAMRTPQPQRRVA